MSLVFSSSMCTTPWWIDRIAAVSASCSVTRSLASSAPMPREAPISRSASSDGWYSVISSASERVKNWDTCSSASRSQ